MTTKSSAKSDRDRQHELTAKLVRLKAARENVEQQIHDIIDVARTPAMDGRCLLSWEDIGTALGVTRQSAWQRYWSEAHRWTDS